MKLIFSKILWVLFCIPTLLLANGPTFKNGKYTKEKAIKKEFSVSNDALLVINNSYGNLDITSWDQDKIVIDVVVKVSGNDKEKVLEKLDNISISFESYNKSQVKARTIFKKNTSSWWSKLMTNWKNSQVNMQINYVVKIPATNSVNLTNDYGTITLDTIEGDAKINCDYGQVLLNNLLGDNNTINIDYTHNSVIKYMKNGTINADYSDFDLEKAGTVKLVADYSQSHITTIDDLTYSCDYGSLKIKKGNTINGNGDYLNTKITSVSNSLKINSDYGSLKIYNLEPTINEVAIKTSYVGVDVGFDPTCNFDFSIKTSYGGIKLDEDITLNVKDRSSHSKHYQGFYGTSDTNNNITITSSYGGVSLKKK
ncbi:hypothetical protein ACFSTE_17600 [Aquimarina hainanensis]|uniref:Adhesin domain-containing protein n=1 Tax=Aquimarina hainanensis TaxID=1578017 RepID=A0ABW5NAK9_9FLAO